MELETKIYERGKSLSIFKLIHDSLRDLYKSRFLAKQLATRDIKSQYRQSFLGIFWAFVGPLSTAFVWIFLNKSGAVAIDDTGVPYPLFVFCGTLLWSTLVEAINTPLSNTNAAKGILSKINLPKEAIILSGIYKLLFNSSFKFLLIVFFLIYYKVNLSWSILYFPLSFLVLIMAGTTIGLITTPLGMLYTDVARLISLSMSFIMYITPVVYVMPKEGIMKVLMEINPLTPLLLVNKTLLLGTPMEYLNYFLWIAVVMIPLFLIALVVYRVSIPVIIERFSA
ncbi:ABC transporter permease [uncultured Dokdonia sp.]|uniref:ABC transporter permease n=1 Tax=uncultured Dokdonia sp. TaxID=575653 RepID=UPI0030ED5F34|tara:strand:+ start:40172 stop:41017 length:846 start_codon:yes stop_codon:yes gene_type:complete